MQRQMELVVELAQGQEQVLPVLVLHQQPAQRVRTQQLSHGVTVLSSSHTSCCVL